MASCRRSAKSSRLLRLTSSPACDVTEAILQGNSGAKHALYQVRTVFYSAYVLSWQTLKGRVKWKVIHHAGFVRLFGLPIVPLLI